MVPFRKAGLFISIIFLLCATSVFSLSLWL